MDIKVTPAVPEDAEAIQQVLYTTWLATYPNEEYGITREDIEHRFKDRFSEEFLSSRRVQIANPVWGNAIFVAKDERAIVGVVIATRHADRNELQAIYVLPAYHGKGIGRMLWNAARAFFDATKDTTVEVAVYNEHAISFYTKLGFEDTGNRFEDERFRMQSGSIIPEIEMIIRAKKA